MDVKQMCTTIEYLGSKLEKKQHRLLVALMCPRMIADWFFAEFDF